MGDSSGEGTTILETPPYVIAIIFCFFLVITLTFEKLLHLLKHTLIKRGKHGLLAAMNNMTNELMLLGVATLILLLFQNDITSYCMNATHYTTTWLDHVTGCSCCLERTKGVSACYLAAKGCVSKDVLGGCCNDDIGSKVKVCKNVFDLSTDWDVPNTSGTYLVNSVTGVIITNGTDAAAEGRRRLQGLATMRMLLAGTPSAATGAEEVQCSGRIQTGWDQCGNSPNSRPAIGPTALHQIHLFIFITAIVHITLGVLLILASSLRLHFWRRWKDSDDQHAHMIQKEVDAHGRAMDSANAAGWMESQAGGKLQEQGALSGGAGQPGSDGIALDATHDMMDVELPMRFEVPRDGPWRARPEKLRGFWPHVCEFCACVGRQFMPNVVTREEFSIMRAAFLLTHHIRSSSGFDFVDYLGRAMEDDFSHVVGLGLPMWIFIIIFVLLSSAIGWCIWVFILLSGALLCVVNTKLVWIARYVTRGGCVHRLKPGIFWLNRPWMLLPVIKFLLFFVSFVFANSIFFATQFGPQSCFFSRVGFQGNPVPWWVLMVVNTIFLASLCMLTLPLYSLVVQMGGDFKPHLMPAEIVMQSAQARSVQQRARRDGGLRQLLSHALPLARNTPHGSGSSLEEHEQLSDRQQPASDAPDPATAATQHTKV